MLNKHSLQLPRYLRKAVDEYSSKKSVKKKIWKLNQKKMVNSSKEIQN